MLPRPAPFDVLAVGLLAALAHCSLAAPSDQALMGGDKGDGGRGDAGDDGSLDAGSSADVVTSCLNIGDTCDVHSACCSSLVCDTAAGVCVTASTCAARGHPCPGGDAVLCCSGTCVNNVCR